MQYLEKVDFGVIMTSESKDNHKLTVEELDYFREILLKKRNELLSNFSQLEIDALREERSDLSTIPLHLADLGTDSYEQEFALDLLDGEGKLIVEINQALDRIDNNTYGICENDERFIGKPRLEAIPWAKYCVQCAGQIEKKGKKGLNSTMKYTFPDDSDDVEE